MKKPYIKLLGLLVIIIAISLVFTSLKSSKKFMFAKTAEELHEELVDSKHYLDPNTAWEIISKKNSEYVFVDIRNPRDFENFHIEGAINIPMQRALDDGYINYLKSNKKKVLYSQSSVKADQIRVLLTQYGYENLYVLQGGATYWQENMLSENLFKAKAEFDDEKMKFDLNKAKTSK